MSLYEGLGYLVGGVTSLNGQTDDGGKIHLQIMVDRATAVRTASLDGDRLPYCPVIST
jgi:hypothetical protein